MQIYANIIVFLEKLPLQGMGTYLHILINAEI